MKTTSKYLIALAAFVLLSMPARSQTTVPSTTLCAAITNTATTNVCLASTAGIVNQTGLYVDNEYMVVNLANNQTLAATNAYVPVTRNNRAGNGPPSIHNSGATVWIALGPGQSVVPGANGFVFSTQLGDSGPCTRSNIDYLPHIWPDRGVIRDCNAALGYWVDYVTGPVGNFTSAPLGEPSLLTTNGAINPHTQAVYVVTKAGVLADTLAAPTAIVDDFKMITILSSTANAHTVTATGLLQTGSASVNVATFAANAGASLTLMAYNGKWLVVSSNQITFS